MPANRANRDRDRNSNQNDGRRNPGLGRDEQQMNRGQFGQVQYGQGNRWDRQQNQRQFDNDGDFGQSRNNPSWSPAQNTGTGHEDHGDRYALRQYGVTDRSRDGYGSDGVGNGDYGQSDFGGSRDQRRGQHSWNDHNYSFDGQGNEDQRGWGNRYNRGSIDQGSDYNRYDTNRDFGRSSTGNQEFSGFDSYRGQQRSWDTRGSYNDSRSQSSGGREFPRTSGGFGASNRDDFNRQGDFHESWRNVGANRDSSFGQYSSGTNSNDWGVSHRGKGPQGYTRSDERIHEQVCDLLTDADIDASSIEVSVKEGEVTLSGTVTDKQAKRHAEDIAERVAGVKDVNNQIRVSRQESSMSSSKDGKSAKDDNESSRSLAGRTASGSSTDSKRTQRENGQA